MKNRYFRPLYQSSWAFCVGIDKYSQAKNLSCASNDARAVRNSLIEYLGFNEEKCVLLLDEEASRAGIISSINSFLHNPEVSSDDRVIFFFAGHGHTIETIRGDVGYLIPHDAVLDDVSTFIPWTYIAELFEHSYAKHVLFILDACYSGLAVEPKKRGISQRFVRDLLEREARQVIASGKKDQEVADGSSERPDHSIFTSELLNILERKTLKTEIVTATHMMSHLQTAVGNHPDSEQTPHYGTLFGDGDMLLFRPDLDAEDAQDAILTTTEYTFLVGPSELWSESSISTLRGLLGDATKIIDLDAFVVEQVRQVQLWHTSFMEQTRTTDWQQKIPELIAEVEDASHGICIVAAMLGHWGVKRHYNTVAKFFSELFSPDYIPDGGNVFLLALARYHVVLAVSAFSTAAVISKNNHMLAHGLTSDVIVGLNKEHVIVAKAHARFVLDINRAELLKRKDGMDGKRFPTAESIYLAIQNSLEQSVFPGPKYERAFTESEILLFLSSYTDGSVSQPNEWGPPGRFLYQTYNHDYRRNQLLDMKDDSEEQLEDWWPTSSGLVRGGEALANAFTQAISWSNRTF